MPGYFGPDTEYVKKGHTRCCGVVRGPRVEKQQKVPYLTA